MPSPTPSPAVAQARARVAAGRRHHPDDHDLHARDVRDLRAAKLAERIRELVESAPPLTAEQRSRLAALFWSQSPTRDSAA